MGIEAIHGSGAAMQSHKQYIERNVFGRCGQVVSRLVEAQLIPRPEMPSSESEIYEWWLVSPDLAERLRARRMPVLQFLELNLWGRTSTGVPLAEDAVLLAVLNRAEQEPSPRRRQPAAKQRASARPARSNRPSGKRRTTVKSRQAKRKSA